jgi:hypothetical protein
VVSAPEGGDLGQAMILLELIREYHAPLVVLPKGHPGSARLKMVISAGDEIELNCSIQRGTHPKQHLLCGSEEMAGMVLKRTVMVLRYRRRRIPLPSYFPYGYGSSFVICSSDLKIVDIPSDILFIFRF